jgi:hypothetical protein
MRMGAASGDRLADSSKDIECGQRLLVATEK